MCVCVSGGGQHKWAVPPLALPQQTKNNTNIATSFNTVSLNFQVAEVDSEQEIDTVIESPHQDETLQTASHPRRSSAKKRTDDKVDEAFQLMKTLTELATKRDEYYVFGENVAHKLRNCGKSRPQVSIAQHKNSEVIFNLEMGYLGQGVTHYPQHSSYS